MDKPERMYHLDRFKYSTISHRGMRYCDPFSATKVEQIIELLALSPDDYVLDIGTGKAELLIRLVERFGVAAVGVDYSSPFHQEAREQVAQRIPQAKFSFLEEDATTFRGEPESFALASCMGACDIFDGFAGTLRALARFVHPGGYLLLGDGYWKQEPAPAYLESFGGVRDECQSHAENVASGVAQGLIPLYASVCNDDEWDRYEWLHLRNIELYAREQPTDPDVPALLERVRAWRDSYLRWGRDTLGFGLYLFQK